MQDMPKNAGRFFKRIINFLCQRIIRLVPVVIYSPSWRSQCEYIVARRTVYQYARWLGHRGAASVEHSFGVGDVSAEHKTSTAAEELNFN